MAQAHPQVCYDLDYRNMVDKITSRVKKQEAFGWQYNHKVCDECGEGGNLLHCSYCPASIHYNCCNSALNKENILQAGWTCHQCVIAGNVKVILKKYQKEFAHLGKFHQRETSQNSLSPIMPVTADLVQVTKVETSGSSSLAADKRESGGDLRENEKLCSNREFQQSVKPSQIECNLIKNSINSSGQQSLIAEEAKHESSLTPPNSISMLIAAASLDNTSPSYITQENDLNNDFSDTITKTSPKEKCINNPLEKEAPVARTCLPKTSCHVCSRSARILPMIQCDFCPFVFHLDCLDIPLTKPTSGQWMCPKHSEREQLGEGFGVSLERFEIRSLFKSRVYSDGIKTKLSSANNRKLLSSGKLSSVKSRTTMSVPRSVKDLYNSPLMSSPPKNTLSSEVKIPLGDEISEPSSTLTSDQDELSWTEMHENANEFSPHQATSSEQLEAWLQSVVHLHKDIALTIQKNKVSDASASTDHAGSKLKTASCAENTLQFSTGQTNNGFQFVRESFINVDSNATLTAACNAQETFKFQPRSLKECAEQASNVKSSSSKTVCNFKNNDTVSSNDCADSAKHHSIIVSKDPAKALVIRVPKKRYNSECAFLPASGEVKQPKLGDEVKVYKPVSLPSGKKPFAKLELYPNEKSSKQDFTAENILANGAASPHLGKPVQLINPPGPNVSQRSNEVAKKMFASISTCYPHQDAVCRSEGERNTKRKEDERNQPGCVMKDDLERSVWVKKEMKAKSSRVATIESRGNHGIKKSSLSSRSLDAEVETDLHSKPAVTEQATPFNPESNYVTSFNTESLVKLASSLPASNNVAGFDSNLLHLLALQRLQQLLPNYTNTVEASGEVEKKVEMREEEKKHELCEKSDGVNIIQAKKSSILKLSKETKENSAALSSNNSLSKPYDFVRREKLATICQNNQGEKKERQRLRGVLYHIESRSIISVYRKSLLIGTSSACDVNLSKYKYCNEVLPCHAMIFYEQLTQKYELLCYGECDVDNFKYGQDISKLAGSTQKSRRTCRPGTRSSTTSRAAKKTDLAKGESHQHELKSKPLKGDIWMEAPSCGCKYKEKGKVCGWEGSAILRHGSVIRCGCIEFVFCATDTAVSQISKPETNNQGANTTDATSLNSHHPRMWYKTVEILRLAKEAATDSDEDDRAYSFSDDCSHIQFEERTYETRRNVKERLERLRDRSSTVAEQLKNEDVKAKRSSSVTRKATKSKQSTSMLVACSQPPNRRFKNGNRSLTRLDAKRNDPKGGRTQEDDVKPARFSARQKMKKGLIKSPLRCAKGSKEAAGSERNVSNKSIGSKRKRSPASCKDRAEAIACKGKSSVSRSRITEAPKKTEKPEKRVKKEKNSRKISSKETAFAKKRAKMSFVDSKPVVGNKLVRSYSYSKDVKKKKVKAVNQGLDCGNAPISNKQNACVLGSIQNENQTLKPASRGINRPGSVDLTCNEILCDDGDNVLARDRLVLRSADYCVNAIHEPTTSSPRANRTDEEDVGQVIASLIEATVRNAVVESQATPALCNVSRVKAVESLVITVEQEAKESRSLRLSLDQLFDLSSEVRRTLDDIITKIVSSHDNPQFPRTTALPSVDSSELTLSECEQIEDENGRISVVA